MAGHHLAGDGPNCCQHGEMLCKKKICSQGTGLQSCCHNCPEWIAFDQAALSLGLIVVPLFANDRPENIAYILENTEAKILLCPGESYWQQLAPILD